MKNTMFGAVTKQIKSLSTKLIFAMHTEAAFEEVFRCIYTLFNPGPECI